MQIEPIRKKSVVQDAISKIKELIDEGYFKFGERLPAERDLAISLGISLPSLREALRALSILGITDMVPGSGTYLRSSLDSWSNDPFSMLFELKKTVHIDLFDARRGIEGIIAELAAERRTDEDLERMELALKNMRKNVKDRDLFLKFESKFHEAVIHGARNFILRDFMEKMYKLLYESRRKTIKYYKDVYKEGYLEHYKIYKYIKKQDVKGARKAMVQHLSFLEKHVREEENEGREEKKEQ
jgi:GntR family transcriptional repressor for pyruvate dehydrogenase complex